MAESPHLLIVDDEAGIRESIEDYFSVHGFTVHAAASGTEMDAVLARAPVSLVLLDLRMPGEDGFSLCRRLRESHDLGIIMLTGSAETIDKVVGLEVGADDYVEKPFDLRELLARVKSLLRRMGDKPTAAAGSGAGDSVALGRATLNLTSRLLSDEAGVPIPLSAMEFDLLKVFIDHPNHVLTRDRLLDLAHNRDWDPYDRSIDVRINRLRKKIEPDPGNPTVIRTVRGAGYIFSPGGG